MSITRFRITQTPSNTASNTPTNTASHTPCPTFTATQTITPTLTTTPTPTCPFSNIIVAANQVSSADKNWVISYTYDGLNWSSSTNGSIFSGSTGLLGTIDVATDGTKWVVGAGTGNVLGRSNDGINWNIITSANTLADSILGVATNGSIWLAMGSKGSNGVILYSYDTQTWAPILSSGATLVQTYYDAYWNGSMWMVGAFTGGVSGATGVLQYSYDGLNWFNTTNGDAIFNSNVRSITSNGSRWVAVGGAINELAYSDDGLVWSGQSTSFFASGHNVLWDGGKFIAGGQTTSPAGVGQSSIIYSLNGIDWYATTGCNDIFTLNSSMAYNGSFYVAGGINLGAGQPRNYGYSTDGLTWISSSGFSATFSFAGQGMASIPSPYSIPPIYGCLPPPTPTMTPSNTATSTPTITPTMTSTPPVITPTNTATQTQTSTPTITQTQTQTNTETPTNTPSITATQTQTNTPTSTSPVITPTITSTPTNTSTQTQTNTPTSTSPVITPTNTATNTETPTPSITASQTQTQTNTGTPTNTPTQTNTDTPTSTPTNTSTQTGTPEITPSMTQTNTSTATPTSTSTCSNYNIEGAPSIDAEWIECDGTTNSGTITTSIVVCAQTGSVYQTGGAGNIIQLGACFSITPTPSMTQTSTPPITPTNTPTNTATMTNTPTNTSTNTSTPTNTPTGTPPVEECSFVVVNTQPSLDIPIYDVYVNGVQVVYSSGGNWTITPSNSPGTFTTSQTGNTQTVAVYYSSNIAGQRIEILDCDEITQCQNINPGGGIATFTDVVIRCGCYWSINGYDGTC
jgi:hypothetical protein